MLCPPELAVDSLGRIQAKSEKSMSRASLAPSVRSLMVSQTGAGIRWRGTLVWIGSPARVPIFLTTRRAKRKPTACRPWAWVLTGSPESAVRRSHGGHLLEVHFHLLTCREQDAAVLADGLAVARHFRAQVVEVLPPRFEPRCVESACVRGQRTKHIVHEQA